jgi:glyoxylase-like metal-dependent hydrolase (beta-lactamase superfamily II)
VTDVILTHLHLDHAGGTARAGPGGTLELAFPNATYHVQRRQLRWAHHPSEIDASGFDRATCRMLEQSGKLHLMEGETELFEGVQVCVSEGHTVGMQLVRVQDEGLEVVFCADLIPTAYHLTLTHSSAYDLYPLTLIEEKKTLLAHAVEEDAVLFFAHDPRIAACRVRDADGVVVPAEPVSF